MKNLKEIVKQIEREFKNLEANAGTFVYGDVYELNHNQEVVYPAMVVTNDTHQCNNDFIYYNFNIFYVDRLTANKKNKLDVHAMAIKILNSIVQRLDNDYIIDQLYQINLFEEKFNDVCAGGYIKVILQLPIELCQDIDIEV